MSAPARPTNPRTSKTMCGTREEDEGGGMTRRVPRATITPQPDPREVATTMTTPSHNDLDEENEQNDNNDDDNTTDSGAPFMGQHGGTVVRRCFNAAKKQPWKTRAAAHSGCA